MAPYTFRWFEPGDRDGIIALCSNHLEPWTFDREWFDWKYRDNPYADHVPIVVAERDGSVVGVRPFFPLPVRVDGRRRLALEPADAVVHPDHRGRGLFTEMTERAIAKYEGEGVPFFFNFPNEAAFAAERKLGWQDVGEHSRRYRLQHPSRLLQARIDSRALRAAGRIGGPLVRAYNALRAPPRAASTDRPIRRESTAPAAELASIYRRSVPAAIHAARDEAFYEWRLGNPNWEYTTYLTDDGADPSAIVVGDTVVTSAGTDVALTRLFDVVPLEGAGRDGQLEALLARILLERDGSDLVVAPASVVPAAVTRRFGFLGDDSFPLSYLVGARTHAVRALGDWEVDGLDVRDPRNWLLSFVELDTS